MRVTATKRIWREDRYEREHELTLHLEGDVTETADEYVESNVRIDWVSDERWDGLSFEELTHTEQCDCIGRLIEAYADSTTPYVLPEEATHAR